MKPRFIIENGELLLTRPFQKRLTVTQRLELAIEKWQLLATSRKKIRNTGSDTCALCDKFFRNPDCTGCPVVARTRRENCLGTPYPNYEFGRSSFAKAAKQELAFLQSLLRARKKGPQ